MKEMGKLIKKVLFDGLNDLTQIQSLFAETSLNQNLKNLLSKLIAEKLVGFRKTLVDEQSNK